jgi:energy-coupling factor transporter ATP-binding protein EcfA2
MVQQEQVLRGISILRKDTHNLKNTIKRHTSVEHGIGNCLVEFLTCKIDSADRRQEQNRLREAFVATIFRSNDHDVISKSWPEISQSREKRLRTQFLAKLRYSHMEDREDRITEAHAATFKWIFADKVNFSANWCNFKAWLTSEKQLYWITGKAGSGKSTLMKYICKPDQTSESGLQIPNSHSRCEEYLKAWAGDCLLVTATFYFWNSGVQLQMTQAGLFRSLLAQILGQIPHLVPLVAPKRWEALCLFEDDSVDFTEPELQTMLRSVVHHFPEDTKLCLFIDGLDEFSGDPTTLLGILKEILTNARVKLCVASRPWVVFQDAFEHSPSLMLQDLTRDDIKAYVSSMLKADPAFALLQRREPIYARQLVTNIVSKSLGVFLWVRLVVSSLLAGMGHGDRISDLQRRLDLLPPELEQLYEKMLGSLDPFYLEHAAQLFILLEESCDPMSLLLLSFVDDDDWQLGLHRVIKKISPEEAAMRGDTMRRRINSRCKGFLEAAGSTGQPSHTLRGSKDEQDWTVQYLHRTVKDFIQSSEVQNRLRAAMRANFDPHLQLCSGNIAFLKSSRNVTFQQGTADYFWRVVSRILYSASKIKSGNSKMAVRLLDDLDRTGRSLARVYIESASLGSTFVSDQWVSLHPLSKFPSFGRHFLSLAVRHGVVEYIALKTNAGCLVQQPTLEDGAVQVHPLLLDAVFMPPDVDQDSLESVPDCDMIACLLNKGAKCNVLGQMDVWRIMVESMVEVIARDGDIQPWLKAIKQFAECGQKLPSIRNIELWAKASSSSDWNSTQIILREVGMISKTSQGLQVSWIPWASK